MSSVICIFGASITWGAFDLELGGWANRLRLYFDNQPDPQVRVYNLGISGDKTSDVLNRFKAEASSRKPDKIILAIGTNDSVHANCLEGTKLTDFEKQYKELVQKAKKFTEDVLVLGLTNVDDKNDKGYKNESLEKYNLIIKKVASGQNLPFVDLFGILLVDEFEDGLHPNIKGHQKIFEKVKEALKV
ncbi:MAG: Lipolytic protein G-D-S-L family [Candidatus Curtissbacteria bacterium GW2011_GWA1_40_9]|uniref:Lipolytic protein G-D-S-L family n=1 Tax=Candidatus Curtissbacteria bacterium GW2011_GWA1_40_9 TaxID=1618408 RepID=A0A0G0TLU3_9BACT|nr:MAG: Lipolytic protein G-D-S-L family [Candidatus Curtissbacteria bacterium GW2011_GWA1_40_9]